MVVHQPGSDIWVYEWQRDAWTKLSFGGTIYFSPVWSPDGRYVVFGSVGKGIFWTRSDGAGQPQPLIPSNAVLTPCSFSPDGKRLVYTEVAASGPNSQIWTASLEDSGGQLKAGKPDQFLKDSFDDLLPAVSTDGRWVAYTSNESGMFQVYVRAFPRIAGHDGKWLISAGPGVLPTWSSNGRDLLYRSGDQIMAVSYTANGDSFVPDRPRVAWAEAGIPQIALRLWDLAPDAKRLIVVAPVSNAGTPKTEHEVVLLQNFYDELRRRLPSK
jgi:Tol biopolymer transport system component